LHRYVRYTLHNVISFFLLVGFYFLRRGDTRTVLPVYSSSLPDTVGNPLSNVTGTAPHPDGPGLDAFESPYEQRTGTSNAPFRAYAYDAAAVLLLAGAAADANEGPAIRDRMSAVVQGDGGHLPGYVGTAGVRGDGEVTVATYELFAFGEQGLHTVGTVEFSA
jgi:hypothetical protein